MKMLCKNCSHCKSARTGYLTERYWCSLTGDGYNGNALGIYPWKRTQHPKCPLRKIEVEQ